MPWNEIDPMNECVKFIARYLQDEEPFATLCAIERADDPTLRGAYQPRTRPLSVAPRIT